MALELGVGEIQTLQVIAKEEGIMFFSTAFDEDAATLLNDKFNIPAFKIASGSLLDFKLLRHIAGFNKPMIVSTGGHDAEDVSKAVEFLTSIGAHFSLLHCVASYPTKPEDMNLRVISWMREAFPDVVIGLSDHYNGTVTAPLAYMLGARIIEKHFTLDHTWKGTDNAFSLEPEGFRKMVRDVRRTSILLGDGVKRVLEYEKAPIHKMARSPYAVRDIVTGDVIFEDDLELQTPADGIDAWKIEKLIGATARRCFKKGDLLST
jgi:N-acetylneuraminate synthase/sialic acid synthase